MESFIGLFDPNDQDEVLDADNNGNKCKSFSSMELGDDVKTSITQKIPFDSNPSLNKASLPEYLPPEAAEGNIEYKLKLVNPSKSRFEHLVTQMKWRLREGQGEAIYEIGVEDGGLLVGLSPREMEASMRTLYLMAEKLGATLTVLRQRTVSQNGEPKKAAEVLVRKVPDDQQTIELRAAVLGNLDVGKSTLLGVLTQGEPDNGHGSARLNLFRHLHEIQSGRTSSISREILGFDSSGCPVTYNICRTSEEICETASKLINFVDVAGHAKYLKTTIKGIFCHSPHFAMLVVSAISGIAGTTREHLGLAMALDVPVVVVVNKLDLAGRHRHALEKNLDQLKTLLKGPGCKKVPMTIETKDDALTAASLLLSDSIAPIFLVSCVTGEGLNLLYTFLHVLPPGLSTKEREKKLQDPLEFQIDETFRIPDVGDVVGGLLVGGIIREGDHLLVGPTETGAFRPVTIHSLHRHKVACRVVRACESATLAVSLSRGKRDWRMACSRGMDESESSSGEDGESPFYLRRGMVIVSASDPLPPVCQYFQARIRVLFHATVILPGFQATVHIGNVRQTATVVGVANSGRGLGVATNETASVMFKFMRHPECIHPGTQLLFREGNSKGIGQVTQVFRVDDGSSVGVQTK